MISIGALVYAFYLHLVFARNSANSRSLREIRLDVAKLGGEIIDLTDRFTRWQKRKNMQEARQEKTSQRDLLEEATKLVGEAPGSSQAPGTSPKAELYRKLRH